MSAVVYLHEPMNGQVLVDKHHLRLNLPGTKCLGAELPVKFLVGELTKHDVLLVPDSLQRCTEAIERLKQVARYMGMAVMPMRAYTAKQRIHQPAAVCAEPPTQHAAVRGHHIPARP